MLFAAFLFAVVMGIYIANAYTGKTAKGFYRSDFASGVAVRGLSIISNSGIMRQPEKCWNLLTKIGKTAEGMCGL